MIFNKGISVFLSACLFLLMMIILSSVIVIMGPVSYIGLVFVVVFYFIARSFYTYLRNDDFYKNSRKHSSDKIGEKYLIKGEKDGKKIFVVVWILVILVLATAALWLYTYNHGMGLVWLTFFLKINQLNE